MKRTTPNTYTDQQKVAIKDWLDFGKPIERLPYVMPVVDDAKPVAKPKKPAPKSYEENEAIKAKAEATRLAKEKELLALCAPDVKAFKAQFKKKQRARRK